jgi:hypothetical protein
LALAAHADVRRVVADLLAGLACREAFGHSAPSGRKDFVL